MTLFRVPQTHQASEDPNASVSTVLIEKRRNEIATNWVKVLLILIWLQVAPAWLINKIEIGQMS